MGYIKAKNAVNKKQYEKETLRKYQKGDTMSLLRLTVYAGLLGLTVILTGELIHAIKNEIKSEVQS